jgi:hypothetical protein
MQLKVFSVLVLLVATQFFSQFFNVACAEVTSEEKNQKAPLSCSDYLITKSLVTAYQEWSQIRLKADLQLSNECTEGYFGSESNTMPTVYSCHQEEHVLAKHLQSSIPLASLVREVNHQVGNDDLNFAFFVMVEAHGRNLSAEYNQLFVRINDQYAKTIFFKEVDANQKRHYLLDEESRKLLSLVTEKLNRPNVKGGFCQVSNELLKSEAFTKDVAKRLRNYQATEKPLEIAYRENMFDDPNVLKTAKLILTPKAVTAISMDQISERIEAEAMQVLKQHGKNFMDLERLE